MAEKKPTKRKRKRESTPLKVNGISTLSNLTRSTDDLNENIGIGSPSSRYNCNGILQHGGSRASLINVVTPQILYDRNQGISEGSRKRRVSWEPRDDEEEETVVKEINRQSNGLDRNTSFDNILLQQQQQQCVDVYAQAQFGAQASSPGTHCHGGNCISSVPARRFTTQEREVEILRMKNIEQQRTIAFLLEKDKRRDRLLQKQKRSVSVTSLQTSPLSRTEENRLPELTASTQHVNNQAQNIIKNQNERVFNFPERPSAGVPHRRSRSYDDLDEEEKNPFLIQSSEIYTSPVSSSGYQYVADEIEHDTTNDKEIIEEIQSVPRFNYNRGFIILLVLNAIIILLNGIGIPFWVCKQTDNHEDVICVNCESINYIYRNRFQTSNGNCCLESAGEMLELLANISNEIHVSRAQIKPKEIRERSVKELPMAQFVANGKVKEGNVTRISWIKSKENPIQKVFGRLEKSNMRTIIKVPLTGTYFIYSNVEFIKTNHIANTPVIFGHSIVNSTGYELGSAVETVFPRSNEIRHMSQLSFMYNFTVKESIYVTVTDGDNFNTKRTKFGMFLIGPDTFS